MENVRLLVCLIVIGLLFSLKSIGISNSDAQVHVFEENDIQGISGFVEHGVSEPRFALQVPQNWENMGEEELKGSIYAGGRRYKWRGPRNSVYGTGYTSLIIYVVPSSAIGTENNSLEKYADVLKISRSFGTAEVLTHNAVNLRNIDAFETIIRYRHMLNRGFPAPVYSYRKIAWTVLRRGDYYIDLRYSAEENDFDAYIEAYNRAKQSIK